MNQEKEEKMERMEEVDHDGSEEVENEENVQGVTIETADVGKEVGVTSARYKGKWKIRLLEKNGQAIDVPSRLQPLFKVLFMY